MPVYEYYCVACDHTSALRRRFSESSKPRCDICDSDAVEKIISNVSIVMAKQQRVKDVSWIDRNLAGRIKRKSSSPLNPALRQTVERMESQD